MGCVHSTAEGVEFDFGNREPAPPPPATHAYRPPSPASSSKKAPVLAHQFQTQQVYHKPKETAAAPPPTPIFHPPLPLDSPHTTPPQQHKKPQQQSPRQKHTKHTYIPPSSLEPAKNNLNQHDKGYDVQNSPPTADKKRLPPQARTSNGTDPLPGAPKRLNTPELFFDEKFDRGTKLGAGAFASVFIGIDKRTKIKYAVKQIDRSKMQWSGRDALMDEINSLKALREAPYVVKFQDVFLEGPKICYLVLELLSGGELFERIIQRGNLTEREARNICRCILSALNYMHERRMVHRDLKPENLLLADTIDIGPVKLSDFGFARKVETMNGCRTLCGTPGYLAPEILERWPAYDVKCDSWSFGVILFLLLGGYLPFDPRGSGDINKVFERTRNGQFFFYPQRWENISSLVKDLVAKCLTINPRNRISTKDALAHEWMTEEQGDFLAAPLNMQSLTETVATVEKNKKMKEQQMKQQAPKDRLDDLNDDFTVYMDERKGDSIVSHMTGTNKTVASKYTHFEEDSLSGKPFHNFYKKGDTLGQGGFSTVYRCQHKRSFRNYAAKEIDTSKLSKQEQKFLKEEILALKYLRGAPYTIRLYDVFTQPDRTLLVLEEMRGGTLLSRISEKEVYTELEARELLKVLFLAVNYCHKKSIAHRDIKLENLLLVEPGDDSTVKLADFGFAKKCTKPYGLKTLCGTPNYMAPEIFDLKVKGYDLCCDMWSVGVVVYCVLGGYLPFEGTLRELQDHVIRGEYEFHPEWWSDISSAAKDLIRNLLQTSPSKRYTAEQALGAPWMQLNDGELNYKDLSKTQQRMKTIGAKKVKNVVNAIIGARKFAAAVTENLPMNLNVFESVAISGATLDAARQRNPDEEEEKEPEFDDVYELGEKIGEGIFVNIHLATHRTTKQEFAVKKVIRRQLHPSDAAALNDEMAVLKDIRTCPHVVRIHEVYENPDCTCLVLEHFTGAHPLIDRLIERTKFTEFSAKEMIRNLLKGVSYCHSKRIANRNLKLENLLLPPGSETDVRISDFEYARKVLYPNSLKTQCGTQEYVAPEILAHNPAYDVQCDVWTVGVIIFIMLGGYYPFRGKSEEKVLKKVRYGEFTFHKKYWTGISKEAKDLVKQMMTVNPEERITADEALQSTWIRANDSDLSNDLSGNLEELKGELRIKFKGIVKGIMATSKLQAITE